MIFNIGYLILVIALVVAVFGVVVSYWGGYRRQSNFAAASFHAVYAVAVLVIAASVILWYGLLTDKFQLSYVWNHSERALPVFYKFAASLGRSIGQPALLDPDSERLQSRSSPCRFGDGCPRRCPLSTGRCWPPRPSFWS